MDIEPPAVRQPNIKLTKPEAWAPTEVPEVPYYSANENLMQSKFKQSRKLKPERLDKVIPVLFHFSPRGPSLRLTSYEPVSKSVLWQKIWPLFKEYSSTRSNPWKHQITSYQHKGSALRRRNNKPHATTWIRRWPQPELELELTEYRKVILRDDVNGSSTPFF